MSGLSYFLLDGLVSLANTGYTHCSKIGEEESNTELLADFWEANKLSPDETAQTLLLDDNGNDDADKQRQQQQQNQQGQRKPSDASSNNDIAQEERQKPVSRIPSDASLLRDSRQLEPFHPALSLPQFFTTFGPLIFPLYRAALLRKRVLFLSDAPVQLSCHYGKSTFLLATPDGESDIC